METFCKTCCTCQLFKKQRKKYGHLPPKEAEELQWSGVNVDLIGPYIVRTPKSTHTLRVLTMIDPVTGWFEVIAIPDKMHILSWKRLVAHGYKISMTPIHRV